MNCSCTHPYADHVLTPLGRDVHSECSHCECSALLPPEVEQCLACHGPLNAVNETNARLLYRWTEDGAMRIGAIHLDGECLLQEPDNDAVDTKWLREQLGGYRAMRLPADTYAAILACIDELEQWRAEHYHSPADGSVPT